MQSKFTKITLSEEHTKELEKLIETKLDKPFCFEHEGRYYYPLMMIGDEVTAQEMFIYRTSKQDLCDDLKKAHEIMNYKNETGTKT